MNDGKIILLLGRRDHPTDGVADYCEQLRAAGVSLGLPFESFQVPWAEKGWNRSLSELRDAAASWRDRWVLLQYTTLAWSRRGFPLRAPRVLDLLRQCGVKTGVVFHDLVPFAAPGAVGVIREYAQMYVLKELYARADAAIFTGPLEQIMWLPSAHDKATFVPVGANCPELPLNVRPSTRNRNSIAVYGVTGGAHTLTEVADIAFAVKHVSQSGAPIRLLLFGRGSKDADSPLRSALNGFDVQIETLGLVPPAQVTEVLAESDVLLFVRGQISSRRGSAIAGIACGLPIVCYAGPETIWPVTDAGVLAAPMGDRQTLAEMLRKVLTDDRLRIELRARSRGAHEKYFSWAAITARFAAALHLEDSIEHAGNPVEADAIAQI